MSLIHQWARWTFVAAVALSWSSPVQTRGQAVAGSPAAATATAAPGAAATRTERQYLSGTSRDDAVPWDFFCTANRKSGRWTTLPVPSCWELHGFGNLTYYDDDPKRVAEQGKYRRAFTVPPAWTGRRVVLVFDGVMTDAEVTVNGQSAGPVHQGAFYQFKYDVTPLLRADGAENLLEVTVSKRSSNESVNRAERKADYWIFGGIFRPVYLEAVPQEHVSRVAIDAKADGQFAVDVYGTTTTARTIEVTVLDAEGVRVGAIRSDLSQPASKTVARLVGKFDGVASWTAETPALYTARVELKGPDGQVIHEFPQRFGFRTVEVRRGDGVYVNGRRVMLKGVNRHASDPDSGRTLSPALDRADIELMKQMNMNAVRMSHYPPDKSFLELCDELGLYVINELAGWQKSYDADIATKLVEELIVRDVNHPSILFWANGNEGGWNTAVDGEYAKWDPQGRAVLHPWSLHGDIDTKHYPPFAMLTQRLAARNVFMPTEFLHGLYDGGIGAGLRDYWDAMRASPVGAGGFLWVFADEGIRREDGRIDVAGNAAPDGIVGPYREKEASFYTVKKIWSPVVLPDSLPADFDGRLGVSNCYDFTPLNDVKFKWELRRWSGIDDDKAGHEVTASGVGSANDVMPGKSGTLALALPAAWREGAADAIAVTASDPDGREIWTWVYPLGRKPVAALLAGADLSAGRVVDHSASELISGDAVMTVDSSTGAIRELKVNGKLFPLSGGPRLSIAAPAVPPAQASAAGSTRPAPATRPTMPRGALHSASWRAGRDGWFRLAYEYEASGPCDYIGVSFDLPEQAVTSARWLGSGPHRVWKNRMDGPTLGVWENEHNDSITGWSGWKYPEFKGFFGDLHWAKLTTSSGTITIAPETPGLFLRLLTPSLPPDNLARTTRVAFPDGGLSLMHAIPGIGSKLQTAAENGPSGMPSEASGTYRATVWFRFSKQLGD